MSKAKFNPYDLAPKSPESPLAEEKPKQPTFPAAPANPTKASSATPVQAAPVTPTKPASPIPPVDPAPILSGTAVPVRPELVDSLNVFLGRCEMMLERSKAVNNVNLMFELQKIYSSAKYLMTVISNSEELRKATLQFETGATDVKSPVFTRPPTEMRLGEVNEQGRILLVDDDATLLETLKAYLEICGHTVTTARGGKDALMALHTGEEFDLALVDLMMPEMDGFQFLSFLKSDMSWRDLPVIIFSGLRETTNAARCLEMGANDYLTKPIDPVLLRARINTILEQKRLRHVTGFFTKQQFQKQSTSDEINSLNKGNCRPLQQALSMTKL